MSVTPHLKRIARIGAGWLLCLIPAVVAGQEGDVVLTLPQARAVAAQALTGDRPDLTAQIALGLLQADPKSSYAHFMLANAYSKLGHPADGRKSAARAFRHTQRPAEKFAAAELAARLSYAEDHLTLTQLWLRRAAQNAPNAQVERQLARDYARVRQENPLSFYVNGEIRPSSNVNNGADTARQVIDGLPFTGQLSGSAQALSGLITAFDGMVGYRLRGTSTSFTEISARLYARRVMLDSAAQALAPDLTNSDLASTYGQIELGHKFAVGHDGESANMAVAVGQYWMGGDPNYRFMRLSGGRSWQLGAQSSLRVNGTAELRLSARSDFYDSRSLGADAGLGHRLQGGDRIGLSLSLQQSDSDFVNSRVSTAALRLTYSFAQKWGPALVSTGLVLGASDYPEYVAIFGVPGGRQDTSTYGDLNVFLPDLDYAGFAPTLRVRAGRSRSNVSRFDTKEVSFSIGIKSKF